MLSTNPPLTPQQTDYFDELVLRGLPQLEAYETARKTILSGAVPIGRGQRQGPPKHVVEERQRQRISAQQVLQLMGIEDENMLPDLEALNKLEPGTQLCLFHLAKWNAEQRGLPNDLLRTAVFSARDKRLPRERFHRTPLYAWNKDVIVSATGTELRSDEELSFLHLCELAKHHKPGKDFAFHMGSFCKTLQWPANGRSYTRLIDSLALLQSFVIEISTPRLGGKTISVAMAGKLTLHEQQNTRRTYGTISLPQEILVLFADEHYTKLNWEATLALTPIGRRLFELVSSHKEPYPMPMRNFAKLAFLTVSMDTQLRRLVKNACAQLKDLNLVHDAWLDEKDQIRIIRLG